MKQIIEGGHFYAQEGFSTESQKGWGITQQLANINGNQSMLFIDDVHEKSFSDNLIIIPVHIKLDQLVGEISEKCMDLLKNINENNTVTHDQKATILQPNHIILESQMQSHAQQVLEILQDIPGKKKAKMKSGKGFYSGSVKLTHGETNPTCALFDAGLTLHKQQLGFDSALNVLPEVYKSQQEQVNKIYQLINPDFPLSQKYFTI